MIRKKLTRLMVVAMSAVLVVGFSACGKKKADADNKETEHVTLIAETKSIADKELAKTEIVTFEYEDGDGNIVRLEGKAVAGEDGNATIEVEDKNGYKVTSQGKASTDSNGKLQVSEVSKVEEGKSEAENETEPIPTEAETQSENITVAPVPEPDPEPTPEEPSKDDSNKDDSDNGGYDFPTVEGPNGPMYGFTGDNYSVVGQDVNQGSNMDCPYALKTVTTRNAFISNHGENSFRNITGYYYVALNEYGDEVPLGQTTRMPYCNELGWNYCEARKVGTFSCGDVWFRAYIGW